jgi:hypothetical protein
LRSVIAPHCFLVRFSFCRRKRRSQNGAASLWNPAAESVAMWRMPEKPSLERCDSSAEPALVFRTIRATRLSVANYNTTVSSESLETGTGSSNSLRSAKESVRTDTGSGVISWAQRKPGYRKGPRAHAGPRWRPHCPASHGRIDNDTRLAFQTKLLSSVTSAGAAVLVEEKLGSRATYREKNSISQNVSET